MQFQDQNNTLKQWIRDYKGLLFKVTRAYADHAADQDDLFQEILVQLWNSIPNFRGESKVSTWIYRVALFTAMSWLRKEKKHRELIVDVKREPTLITNPDYHDEKLKWLYAEISRLNEIDRSLVLLYLDDCSYKEMAFILGISESNVGVKLNRIKKNLSAKSKATDYGT